MLGQMNFIHTEPTNKPNFDNTLPRWFNASRFLLPIFDEWIHYHSGESTFIFRGVKCGLKFYLFLFSLTFSKQTE